MNRTDRRLLDAAGITGPELREAFTRSRRLHAEFGRSYYLATLLLPPWKRPYVHALYGFARFADEIVDNGPADDRAARFRTWSQEALRQLTGERPATDGVTLAMRHTMRRWEIPATHVADFFAAMTADLTVTDYPTYDHLATYMYGAAGVIGLQLLPVLEPLCDEAYPRARALGEASQLTNIIRDVAEDLGRGRVYLPGEDLERFGVCRADLRRPPASTRVRDLLRFEIDRARKMYAYGRGGIGMLHPSSRPCVEVAAALYSGILDEVEAASYEVLDRRVRVGLPARLRIALPAYVRARGVWQSG